MAGNGATPTICPTLRYRDAKAAVAFLKDAFGFTEVALYEGEGGVIHHAELAYGNGMVMLGSAQNDSAFGRIAKDLGPVSVYVVPVTPPAMGDVPSPPGVRPRKTS